MRLWSIHPLYLDTKGLVAVWREALLAQKVLKGETQGYLNHPQLLRFKESGNPLGAIAEYLRIIHFEAENRGYSFNKTKINDEFYDKKIDVTDRQLQFEMNHLLTKLKVRDNQLYHKFRRKDKFEKNPLFREIVGDVESWEKGIINPEE